MTVRHPFAALAFIAAVALPLGLAADAAAQESPAIAGTWTLNADRTEPPKDRTIGDPESVGSSPTGGRGGSRRGGGRGGGATAGAGMPVAGGGSARGSFGRMFGAMTQASRTLKITQADSVLMVDDEDGPMFVNLRTDGKTLEEPLADQTVLKTRVQWKKADLIVERSHGVNGTARMTMRLDPKDPKVLIVDFRYENNRQRRTIDQRRIYDAASPG